MALEPLGPLRALAPLALGVAPLDRQREDAQEEAKRKGQKAQSRQASPFGSLGLRLGCSVASAPEQFVDESKISALDNCLEKLAPQTRRTVDLF